MVILKPIIYKGFFMSTIYKCPTGIGVRELNLIKSKFIRQAVKIIEHFNLGVELAEQLTEFFVHQDKQYNEQFSLKFDISRRTRIPPSTLTFEGFDVPFKFYLGNNTLARPPRCVLRFDSNKELVSIVFSFTCRIANDQLEQSLITITYNPSFQLINLDLNKNYYNNQTKKFYQSVLKKDFRSLCINEDEFLLLNILFNRDNTMLKEVIPEMYIPSAYDFNSYDYVSRLGMVDMLLV